MAELFNPSYYGFNILPLRHLVGGFLRSLRVHISGAVTTYVAKFWCFRILRKLSKLGASVVEVEVAIFRRSCGLYALQVLKQHSTASLSNNNNRWSNSREMSSAPQMRSRPRWCYRTRMTDLKARKQEFTARVEICRNRFQHASVSVIGNYLLY